MTSSTKSSALLSLSPELQRNIWLELSGGRLIGMVLVVALLVGGTQAIFGDRFIYPILNSILWVLLVLWGPLLAADTIFDEIASRTWDVQRLSAQRASGLIIGKLIGGTLYAWFGALLCTIAMICLTSDHMQDLLNRLLEGVMAQTMAMFAAMTIARFGKGSARGISKLGAWFIGIVFAAFFSTMLGLATGDITAPGSITLEAPTTLWYGHKILTTNFWYAVEVISIAWIIFGMIRLMRRELGYHDGPLGWTLFVIYMMIFTGGSITTAKLAGDEIQSWQGRIFLCAHFLTYVALLGLPVIVAVSRKFSIALKKRDMRAVWTSTSPWMPAALLTLVGAIAYAATGFSHAMAALALIGFALRDIIVVYGCRTRFTRRSEAALVMYFAVVYLFATFVITLGYQPPTSGTQTVILQIFSPFTAGDATPGIGVIFPWVEAALALLMFRKDFAKLHRPITG